MAMYIECEAGLIFNVVLNAGLLGYVMCCTSLFVVLCSV